MPVRSSLGGSRKEEKDRPSGVSPRVRARQARKESGRRCVPRMRAMARWIWKARIKRSSAMGPLGPLLARLRVLVVVVMASVTLLAAATAPQTGDQLGSEAGSAVARNTRASKGETGAAAPLKRDVLGPVEHSAPHSLIDSCNECSRGNHSGALSEAQEQPVREAQQGLGRHKHRRRLAGAAGHRRRRRIGVAELEVSEARGRDRRESLASLAAIKQVLRRREREIGNSESGEGQSGQSGDSIGALAPLAATFGRFTVRSSSVHASAAAAARAAASAGEMSEDLIELLAQFYAHTQEIQDKVDHYFEIQLNRTRLNKWRRKQQQLNGQEEESNTKKQEEEEEIYYNSTITSSLFNSSEISSMREFEKEKLNVLLEQLSSEDFEEGGEKLREIESIIRMKFGADDESLLRWLRQRQEQFSSLKNATFELLKETPNKTINVCPDGPKILVLPNVSAIVHCYTHDQWIEKLWSDLRLFHFVHYPIIALNVLIFLFGTMGNIFVCLSVYRNHHLRNVTNYFIVNLAVADFLVILICLPATVVWDLSLTWFFGTISCKLIMFLQDVSISVSVLTLTAISIDRYYAICHPLKFKSNLGQAKKIIALIWLASLLTMMPDLIYLSAKASDEISDAGLDTVLYSDCNYNWDSRSSRLFQFVKTILLYLLPFILMLSAHYQILQTLQVASRSALLELHESMDRQPDKRQEQQVEQIEMREKSQCANQQSPRPSSSRNLNSAMESNLEEPPETAYRCCHESCMAHLGCHPLEESDESDESNRSDESEYGECGCVDAISSHSTSSPSRCGLSPPPQFPGLLITGRDSRSGHAARLIRFHRSNGLSSIDFEAEDIGTPVSETGTHESAGQEDELSGPSSVPTSLPGGSHARRHRRGLGKGMNLGTRCLRARSPGGASSSNYRPSMAPDNSCQVRPATRCSSGMQTMSSRASVCSYQINVNETQQSGLRSSMSSSGVNPQLLLTMHNKRKLESRRAAAKMLMTITVLFGICYLPVHLINFLRQFIDDIPQTDFTSTISMLAHCICYLNSAMNPIIYNHMNSIFRAEFKNFLSKICCRRRQDADNNVGARETPTAATGIGHRANVSKANNESAQNQLSIKSVPRGPTPVPNPDAFDLGPQDRNRRRRQGTTRLPKQPISKS